MALNDREVLLDLSGLNRILELDEASGRVRVEGGARLLEVYQLVHPKGFTVPASPTESHSSVAGAIAANVNGKDAWRVGSFGEQVVRLSLLTADGEEHEIDRDHAWFPAVVGGMGLLGIVLDATIQLQRVPSPYVETTRLPAGNADELFRRLAAVEATHDAIVVWVDAYARGSSTGRGVIHATRWIEKAQTEAERKAVVDDCIAGLEAHRRFGLRLHEAFGPLLSLMLQVQRPALRFFNWLYFTKGRIEDAVRRTKSTELFMEFGFAASFTVPPAYLVCGPHGYTIQLTFPREDARAAMVELMRICQASPCPPVTTILRVHRADDHWISFSQDGYSLNLEIHPKRRHAKAARRMVDRIVEATAKRGGRIHMTKDQVLTPAQFRRLYPRVDDLLALKRRLDPACLFASSPARRVGACPPGPGPGSMNRPEEA